MFWSTQINTKLKKYINPQDIFPFHWDSTTTTGTFTEEDKKLISELTSKW
jgi:hypothetical protein